MFQKALGGHELHLMPEEKLPELRAQGHPTPSADLEVTGCQPLEGSPWFLAQICEVPGHACRTWREQGGFLGRCRKTE